MRYYTCSKVGDGSRTNPFRPKVADYGCAFTAIYKKPDELEVIVVVEATVAVFAKIDKDLDIHKVISTGASLEALFNDFAKVAVKLPDVYLKEEV